MLLQERDFDLGMNPWSSTSAAAARGFFWPFQKFYFGPSTLPTALYQVWYSSTGFILLEQEESPIGFLSTHEIYIRGICMH